MKLDTKYQLLSFLREKCAYQGKGTVEDVLAFCQTEQIAVDADSIKSLFAKTVKLDISSDDEDKRVGESEAKAEPVAASKSVSVESEKKMERLTQANASVTSGKATANVAARKAYNARAAQGKTKFGSADEAEQFNAGMRLVLSEIFPTLNGIGNYSQKSADMEIVGKDASELVNTLGGYLIGDAFRNELLYSTEAYGKSRAFMRFEDMTGGNTIFPRQTGIPSWSYVTQGTAATASDITGDNVTMVPKQIMALVKTNRQVFEQSAINVGDQIATSLAEGFWNTVEDAIFVADGTSTYGTHSGLAVALQSTSSYVTGAGNSWSAIVASDFTKLISTPQNTNLSGACFAMSRQAFAGTALRIAIGQSGNAASDFLGARYFNSSDNGADAEILGFPVYFIERMPVASASGSAFCYFGDFKKVGIVGLRKSLEIATSEHAGFSSNQIWTRGQAEIAVNICGDGRSGSLGPVACLKTA